MALNLIQTQLEAIITPHVIRFLAKEKLGSKSPSEGCDDNCSCCKDDVCKPNDACGISSIAAICIVLSLFVLAGCIVFICYRFIGQKRKTSRISTISQPQLNLISGDNSPQLRRVDDQPVQRNSFIGSLNEYADQSFPNLGRPANTIIPIIEAEVGSSKIDVSQNYTIDIIQVKDIRDCESLPGMDPYSALSSSNVIINGRKSTTDSPVELNLSNTLKFQGRDRFGSFQETQEAQSLELENRSLDRTSYLTLDRMLQKSPAASDNENEVSEDYSLTHLNRRFDLDVNDLMGRELPGSITADNS